MCGFDAEEMEGVLAYALVNLNKKFQSLAFADRVAARHDVVLQYSHSAISIRSLRFQGPCNHMS